jgi:hypothetical protein
MPLTSSNAGTKANGVSSNYYCILCYKDGAFTEPTISMDEIKSRGILGIKQTKMNIFKKLFLLACYPLQLQHLDRWR